MKVNGVEIKFLALFHMVECPELNGAFCETLTDKKQLLTRCPLFQQTLHPEHAFKECPRLATCGTTVLTSSGDEKNG